jgi:UDP-galactopyranose mutase
MYDFVIVGAGLFGSVCAQKLSQAGKKVLVVEKRNHIGGNCYTRYCDGIHVHEYGPHIFHTNDTEVWEYVNRYTKFNRFVYSPVALYKDEAYSLPFNMWTFNKIWGVITPEGALEKINKDRFLGIPKNLEEAACSMVGYEVYERLIKGYTKKQWGRDPKDLPPEVIKRLPVRLTYDANYFNDTYQGIPSDGYTHMFENMLAGSDVFLNTDFFENRDILEKLAKKVIYTGPIDRYFEYEYGSLDYKTMRWDTKILPTSNYQGVAVINYTDEDIPFTRVIEHVHFYGSESFTNKTVVSWEFPEEYVPGNNDPMYPINNAVNNEKYKKYKELADSSNVIFGGRLAEYKYYDMDKVILSAFKTLKSL